MENNKTAMTRLIEKILRMPESNIKGFLKISGSFYIEAEKEQIMKAYDEGDIQLVNAEQYYNETYKQQDNDKI
jgi:hypothetical protein